MKKTFYITTPIYYANDKPHIGHAYTTVLADVINRYQKLFGHECFFLTGTDEHGQKVQQAAKKRNISEKQHVDEYHQRFKDMWQLLGIQYDHFIRTTDKEHIQFVQNALQELYEKDQIYSQNYQGWYSVGEERFFAEDELVDGKDPISGRTVEWLEEKNYFFKMSIYQDKLIEHIQKNPDFILPEFRKNEVLGFLKKPLQDLCISRPKSRLKWGIALPFDDKFVTYVWFDALLNYQSGVYNRSFKNGEKIWPADYHILGKDILTTHCVYWPTMLMGMERELPRHFLAHGWWLMQDKKMSKTDGNVVNPLDYIQKYGADKVRYFLMREMTIGQDASFTDELFVSRTNTDLANDLGNAINRVNKFVHAHFDGVLPAPTSASDNQVLIQAAQHCIGETEQEIRNMKLSVAIKSVIVLIRAVNKFIDNNAPWKILQMIKSNPDCDPKHKEKLADILYCAAEALRLALSLLYPVIPQKSLQGLSMLGIGKAPDISDIAWGILAGGESLQKGEGLFPRIEVNKSKKQLKNSRPGELDPIARLDFRVVEIENVENHPDADGLYVLVINDGEHKRTVCAGLKNSYTADELRNKKAVLFSNLKPARLRGIVSNGMLLAADMPEEKAQLIDPGSIPTGSQLQFGQIDVVAKKNASLKDFQKISLLVKDEKIYYNKNLLHFQNTPVKATAPDGAGVH